MRTRGLPASRSVLTAAVNRRRASGDPAPTPASVGSSPSDATRLVTTSRASVAFETPSMLLIWLIISLT